MQRKTKSIMTEAQKIEVMIEALNDPTTLKGILPELEEKLKDAARRNPDAFDSILFYGAARLYLKGGADAVRQEFSRRYGTKPADKGVSLGEMVKYKQRAAIERAKEAARRKSQQIVDDTSPVPSRRDDPKTPQIDERFLVADIHERLLLKAEAAGIADWMHAICKLHVTDLDKLEDLYNKTLAVPASKMRGMPDMFKALTDAEEAELYRRRVLSAGIPENLYIAIINTRQLDALRDELLEALVNAGNSRKMWSAGLKSAPVDRSRAMTGLDQSKETKDRNAFWRTEYEPKK